LVLFSIQKDPMTNAESRTLVGMTEVQHDHSNPEFSTTFHVDFTFSKHQRYCAVVYDFDDHHDKEEIGQAEFELGNVVSHLSQGLVVGLKQKG
jgi:Ca2+-dependent lipid-binding protein